jgi:hypothetical protein
MSIYFDAAAQEYSPARKQGPVMIARRHVLFAIWIGVAFATGAASAAGSSARSFVDSIFANYTGEKANGVPLDNDAAIRRYFEPKLAALIIADRRNAAGEVGKLDSDPFIDAQDWQIDAVDVAVRDLTPDKAAATISFKSLGKQKSVVLDLVKLGAGWRIADITWDDKRTLRGIFAKK